MPYTPEQNGVTERENRTLVESAHSMIHSKDLLIKLWAEAVNTAVHVLNRSCPKAKDEKLPFKLWHSKQTVDLKHFRVFGTIDVSHMSEAALSKWDRKSVGFFVGYCDEKNGFRVWIEKKKVVLSQNVIFGREDALEIRCSCQSRKKSCKKKLQFQWYLIYRQKKKSKRKRRPVYVWVYVYVAEFDIQDSFKSAMSSQEAEARKYAMDEEIASLKENDVFDLVHGKKAIGSRWVLRIKYKY